MVLVTQIGMPSWTLLFFTFQILYEFKFPGVGTHEPAQCPGVGTGEKDKCPAPEIVRLSTHAVVYKCKGEISSVILFLFILF